MVAVTVPAGGACDNVLVSNAVPALSLAYQENGDGMPHTYTRANAGKLVTQLIAGRRMPLGFRPLIEGRSDVFDRTFIIAIDTAGTPVPATNIDRSPFDPILALIEEPTAPCVVFLDGHGRRWYTAPEYLQGTYTYVSHEHQATVRFTEVSDVAIPLTVDAPWHP